MPLVPDNPITASPGEVSAPDLSTPSPVDAPDFFRPTESAPLTPPLTLAPPPETVSDVSPAAPLRLALKWASQVSPEEATQLHGVSKRYGVPFDFAVRNKSTLQEGDQAETAFSHLTQRDAAGELRFPSTLSWLQDPANLARARDDVHGLTTLEEATKQKTDPAPGTHAALMDEIWKDVRGETTDATGVQAPPEHRSGFLANAIGAGKDTIHSADLGRFFTANILDDATLIQRLKEEMNRAPVESEPGVGRFLGSVVGGAAPFIGTGLAASTLTTPIGGAIAAGGVMVASGLGNGLLRGFSDAIRAGKSEEEALQAGRNAAATEGAISAALAATLPATGKLASKLAGFRPGVTPTAGQALKFVGADTLGQMVAGMGQSAATNLYYGDPIGQGSIEAAASQGLFSILHIPTLVSAMRTGEATRKFQTATQNLKEYDGMTKAADGSKLVGRDPEAGASLIQQHLEEAGKPSSFWIDPEKLREAFFQDGVDPVEAKAALDKFASDVGLDPAHLEESLTTRADVQVDLPKFVSKYHGSDVEAALKPEMRLGSADAPTMNEAGDGRAGLADEIKRATEEVQKMVDERKLPPRLDHMRKQLIHPREEGGGGMSAEEADHNLAVLVAGLNTIARERGETLAETTDRMGLTLRTLEDGKLSVMQEAQLAEQQAHSEATNQQFDELLYAVEKSGGLQTVKEAKAGNNPLHAELKMIWQAKNKGAAMKLFRKGAVPLDQLRKALEGRGFKYETPAEMLDAISNRLTTGKPEYGTQVDDIQHQDALKSQTDTNGSGGEKPAPTIPRPTMEGLRILQAQAKFKGPTDEGAGRRKDTGTKDMFSEDKQGTLFQGGKSPFSPSPSEGKMDADFAKLADEAMVARRTFRDVIPVAQTTPAVLQALGARAFPLVIEQDALTKAHGPKHEINAEDLKHLPQEIRDPIMVLDSKSEGFNILTSFTNAKGQPVAAAIHLEKSAGRYLVNKIATVSQRDVGTMKLWLQEGLLRYWDKKRATDWLQSVGLQLPEEGAISYRSPDRPILTREDVVKQFGELFQSTPSAPRGFFIPTEGAKVLGLFDAADHSTFIHESSHLFFDQLERLVSEGIASEGARADHATIREWLGAKEGKPLTTAQQEKFARGFESYMMEGKAPSPALVEAFHRFRDWLVGIYKSARGLNVKINDDVRGVFDRLLASQEEIAAARDFYGQKADNIDLMTKDQAIRDALRKQRDETQAAQTDARTAEAMSAFAKSNGGKDALTKEVGAEVRKEPYYKLLDWLKGEKLSLEAIRAEYGEKAAAEIAAKHPDIVTEKHGLSPSEIVLTEGVGTPARLIEMLRKDPTEVQAIHDRVAERTAAREVEIRAEIAADVTPADAALHTQASFDYLIAEQKALAGTLDYRRPPNGAAIRAAAGEVLVKMKVREAGQYYRFAQAEQKFARQATEFLMKGKLADAYEARQKQMLNHALVLGSIKIREEKTKIERAYMSRTLETALKRVENSFVSPIRELVGRYTLLGMADEKYDLAQVKDLDPDGTLYSMMPEWIKRGDGKGDFRETLTFSQLRELDDYIQVLMHVGDQSMLALKEKNVETIEGFVSVVGGTMATLTDKKMPQKGGIEETLNGNGPLLTPIYTLRKLNAMVTQITRLSDLVDGGQIDTAGKLGLMRKLVQAVIAAEGEQNQLLGKTMKTLNAHMETLTAATKRITKEMGKYIGEDDIGLPLSPEYAKIGDSRWTAEKLLAFMLNTGNSDNLGKLLRGHGWNETHIRKVSKLFNEGELRAVQGVWDTIHTLYPALNKAHFEIYNRNIGKIEAKPITLLSRDGTEVTLAGGYYPVFYDSQISDAAARQVEENAMRRDANFRKAMPEKGMTQGRVQGVTRPIRLSLAVLTDHLSDTTKFITHSKVIRDLDRVVRNPSFKDTFTSKFGNEMYATLTRWARDMANPDPSIGAHRDFADQIADRLKTTVSHMFLGWNLPLAFAQVSGVVNSIHDIGVRRMMASFQSIGLAGMKDIFLGKGPIVEEVKRLSHVVSLREKSLQKEMLDEVSKMRTNGKTNKGAEMAFFLYQAFDRLHTIPYWKAVFEMHMETLADSSKSHDEQIKESAALADAKLINTQPSALPATQSEAQRARTGLYRHFMMFSSFFTMLGNNMAANNRLAYEGKISPIKPAKYIAAMWMAMVLEQTLKDLLKGDMPDWMNALMVQPTQGFLGYFPVVKDVARLGSIKKDGSFDVNTDRFTPPALSVPLRLGKKVAGTITTDTGYGPALWETAQIAAASQGLPVANVAKWLMQTHDHLANSEDFKGYR